MTYSTDLRRRVIARVRSGDGKSAACRLFGISRSTLHSWLNRADLSPSQNGFRHRKLNRKDFERHVADHPDALQRERAAHFKVSANSIRHALKRMGATRKKKQTRYLERDSASRIKYLSDLRQSLRRRPGRAVYLDETGFERAAHRPCAWAPKGRKVFGERSGRSRPRTNLIAATAKGKRLFAPLLFEGSLDSSVFNHYLKEQLLKELQPGSLIIMDNAAFHKTQKTRGILEESGHELVFLPPYSPDFNPIEKHFANLKKIRTCQPPDTSIDDIVRLYGY